VKDMKRHYNYIKSFFYSLLERMSLRNRGRCEHLEEGPGKCPICGGISGGGCSKKIGEIMLKNYSHFL